MAFTAGADKSYRCSSASDGADFGTAAEAFDGEGAEMLVELQGAPELTAAGTGEEPALVEPVYVTQRERYVG